MTISGEKEKNNFQRVVRLGAILVALGIGIVIGVYFLLDFIYSTEDNLPKCPPDDPTCEVEFSQIQITDIESFTKKGKYKASIVQGLVSDPIIQKALKESNEKDSRISELTRLQIYAPREIEWTTAKEPTPFMLSIMKNDISHFLKDNLVIQSEDFGEILFGEHIITNIHGANVATSIRTDNFDQSKDNWWKQAKKDENPNIFARNCSFDVSAQLYSEDIIMKISDDNGNLIGIMNSATPCNVTLQSSQIETKIEPVPLDNITPIGNYKISYLQELVSGPIIQNALRSSNQEFSAMTDIDILTLKDETDWPVPGDSKPTDFQVSIINNQVANLLRENLEAQTLESGKIQFPEMILTNAKGVNVASTDRTFNYIQSPYEWWQVAKANEILVRQCGFDITIKTHSEDIIIAIYDEGGEFVGILNSANSCDVVLEKPPYFYGNSN